GAEGARLAREHEPAIVEPVVERLDPEAVARAEEPAPRFVPERERPHAVEALHAAFAPLAVGGEDDLGVSRAAEAVALRFELAPQLSVVVDLAVVNQLERAVLARERLVSRLAQVDDREPAKAERDTLGGIGAGAVGAAVVELRRHALDRLGLGQPSRRDDPADPAHGRS